MKRKRDDIENPPSLQNKIDDPSIPGNEDFTVKLPNETLANSLRFLDLKSLFQTAQVSTRWRQLTKLVRDEKHKKYLEICEKYNLIFLNAVKHFCITYKKEFEEERKFKEKYKDITFQEMIDCYYDDKAYYALIAIAASLNDEKGWIFNEEFLNPLEEIFFSKKSKEFYNILFNTLTYAVAAFTDNKQDAKDKPRLKNLIQQIAQFLIRWQCYLFRNNEEFEIEDEIHKVYKLIGQANNFIGENISIDYLNEDSRNKHLICLQLQLSDFHGNSYLFPYQELDSYDEDFDYTDLSGSRGLNCFLANPANGKNAYFANFTNCKFNRIAPGLMVRIKHMPYNNEDKFSRNIDLNEIQDDFIAHNEHIYKLCQKSLKRELQEKQTEIENLQKRIKIFEQHASLEAKMNQTNPKSEEDTSEKESSSNPKNFL